MTTAAALASEATRPATYDTARVEPAPVPANPARRAGAWSVGVGAGSRLCTALRQAHLLSIGESAIIALGAHAESARGTRPTTDTGLAQDTALAASAALAPDAALTDGAALTGDPRVTPPLTADTTLADSTALAPDAALTDGAALTGNPRATTSPLTGDTASPEHARSPAGAGAAAAEACPNSWGGNRLRPTTRKDQPTTNPEPDTARKCGGR